MSALGGMSRGAGQIARRLKALLWSHKFWIITGIVAGSVILLQLIYPHNRALPFARLDSIPIGTQTIDQITVKLNDRYKQATITTTAPATKISFKEAGIKLATNDSVDQVVNYPWWQRLIPFSSVVRMIRGEREALLSYQSLPLSQWSKNLVAACEKKPVDAGVTVTAEGELQLVAGKTGVACNEQRLIESLKTTSPSPDMRVDTRSSIVQPKRTDKQVSAQLNKLRAVLKRGITVDVAGVQTTADAKTIASWLIFADGPNSTLLPDVDATKVQPFIDMIQKPVYVAPGTTIISMRDGQEISRQPGVPGRGVDSTKLLDSLRAHLREQKTTPIPVQLAAIAPRQDIRRSYTNSAAGLQALLNDLVVGKDMAISIRELSGQNRALSANGDKTYHPASTYKLFIAYSVIKRVEANQLAWTDQIDGKTIDECMTLMIVNSDNACAEAFADKFSWKVVQNELKALGMTATNLNSPSPVSTTNDQVVFLQKLEAGQLMKPENKDKLLELMKRQVYRSGIPSGAAGTVADKVGFLGGVLHDSAIVYGPKGVYVLSIYSSGGSWGNIATVARQISELLNS